MVHIILLYIYGWEKNKLLSEKNYKILKKLGNGIFFLKK